MAHQNGVELPARVKFLLQGVEVTGEKTKTFGEPLFNLSLAGSIKRMLRANQRRVLSPGEEEALEQVITQLCRAYSGEGFSPKTYVSGANYFAIAGEIAEYHHKQGGFSTTSNEVERALTEKIQESLEEKKN